MAHRNSYSGISGMASSFPIPTSSNHPVSYADELYSDYGKSNSQYNNQESYKTQSSSPMSSSNALNQGTPRYYGEFNSQFYTEKAFRMPSKEMKFPKIPDYPSPFVSYPHVVKAPAFLPQTIESPIFSLVTKIEYVRIAFQLNYIQMVRFFH